MGGTCKYLNLSPNGVNDKLHLSNKDYNHNVIEIYYPTVETVGNNEEGNMSKTITNGFNRWDFKSAICRAPLQM